MAINFKFPEIPYRERLVGEGSLVSEFWNRWLQAIVLRVERALWVVSSVSQTGLSASVATTAFPEVLPAGLFRVEYHMRVTQAATSTSSLTFTVSWVDGAVPQSYSWAAMTGNTTATAQSAATLVHCDAGSQVSYAVSYASSGATPMQFRLDGVLYRVGNL